ncbi:Ribonuclease P protein component 4 [Lasiodiplodia hormozganensis]|uniref:Ribonuclease P protein component 4 n=1 Tax=Lasiodiplodia hormozganensis TaxID=869390 RepID=A0AA39Y9L8_9PEZI|nr:Ribonuclease P protein component 4 [Lasiodiplodia hormozganensis]
MAKGDASKPKPVPNKHLHSRISYLYQAATYLANQHAKPADNGNTEEMDIDAKAGGRPVTQHEEPTQNAFPPGLPFYYASHLQSVSMKTQIRLSQNVKHSICKRCSAILIPGSTSSSKIENLSRGGKKPWADVLVVECNVCKAQKRFPVGAKRQLRKGERAKVEKAKPSSTSTGKKVTAAAGMEDRTSITPFVGEVSLGTPK